MTTGAMIIMRWVMMVLLVVFFSERPAYGGWVSLGSDREVGLTVYLDPSTISRNGDHRLVWILYDFTTVQTKEGGTSFLSAKMRREYDCTKEHTRLLTILHYSDTMGNGEMVLKSSLPEQEWTAVGPLESGTIAKDLLTLACSEE